ncbi:type IV pilus modification PilV family protein [Brevibacillus sp. SAFN-007a]|uniref:type IV pilus modification PilV family protein n=1 Tax=Brevibacillus sp. SAFN-007a TaxID=3436862 RepID=UPI003F8216D9
MKVLDNEKGLSLVEVVASLLIFSIALLFLSHFLVRSFEISGNQDNRQVAMNLARQTVEEWRGGNGMIPADQEQEILLEDRYLGKPLSFPLLAGICSSAAPQWPNDFKGIKLADLTINDRVYQTYVLPRFVTTEETASQSLIRIVVRVFSHDAKVAELEALIANPERGQEKDT